ncbi:MAG: transketolase [Melioribacteraceae bacterium]|nr:transketolase [Melioribacteraceae bacterium]
MENKELLQKAINTIRFLAVDAVQKANSGHPGMPMGMASLGFRLFTKYLKHNPKNPNWIDRDRFVLSAGHGSMLLYSLLHLTGYDLSLEDIKNFRQWRSKTPGHPEFGLTPGVETTTGPLGQGVANAVGMAVARAHLSAIFDKPDIQLFDHYIFCIAGDGDMMEGISHEAASFAGHNQLKNLILFYDNNNITIDGELSLAMSENVAQRYESYGWEILKIKDVNNLSEVDAAIEKAKKSSKPVFIVTNTNIGFGSPAKQDTSEVHGSPLGDEEIKATKKNLKWPEEKDFFIPADVKDYFNSLSLKYRDYELKWNSKLDKYSQLYPEDHKKLKNYFNNDFEVNWNDLFDSLKSIEKSATRNISGQVINHIADQIPNLIGGSADLTPSNNTSIKSTSNYSKDDYSGRYIHYGIREHAMGGIMNGMSYYGGIRPYGGTFLVFSDYMRPSIRLAALSHLNPIYIFTHDSIGLGEDGPTHQPIEHISALRAIPQLIVMRPSNAVETAACWQTALALKDRPSAILLTRQKIKFYYSPNSIEGTKKGAYILIDSDGTPDIIIIASGSEVEQAVEAAKLLESDSIKVRVISFISWELFEEQKEEYKNSILPSSIKNRLVIEAGIPQGWEKYAGDGGRIIGINKFGASAPSEVLFQEYGFGVENIVEECKAILNI